MKALLVGCIVLLCFSNAVAQDPPERSRANAPLSAVVSYTDSLHLVRVKGWSNLWSPRDYNPWQVHYGADPIAETTFLKLVGFEEQVPAARKRLKKYRRLQLGMRVLGLAGLGFLTSSLLTDDANRSHTFTGVGASLATVSALGLVIGTSHLRKQGLSPADVQALIDEHNHAGRSQR